MKQLCVYIMANKRNGILEEERGFTLVELAVVMIIIGLLLGGVLKGQELITNAQITSTLAQVKAFNAAVVTFSDMYGGLPGDLPNAGARLPACLPPVGSPACVPPPPALGNGWVDGPAAVSVLGGPVIPDERTAFWLQLSTADLISGVNWALGNIWGGNFPAAKLRGGGFHVGYFGGGAALPSAATAGAIMRAGHYFALHNASLGPVSNVNGFITPNQAARIDTKIDDGLPATGSVIAAGIAPGPFGCALAAGPAGAYNEILAGTSCSLYIRFQN